MNKTEIARKLYEIECIKLGQFTLKSGATSPIYIDMRQIISFPKLLNAIADLMWEQIKPLHADLICGVPYAAIPLATCLSLKSNKSMILLRKEAKAYGTKKMVEGVFQPAQSCLIIEDVITSGSSILTVIQELNNVALKTPYTLSILDRQQGGKAALAEKNCQLFSLFTLTELLTELTNSGIVIDKTILAEFQ